jgi:hypothetical protein
VHAGQYQLGVLAIDECARREREGNRVRAVQTTQSNSAAGVSRAFSFPETDNDVN